MWKKVLFAFGVGLWVTAVLQAEPTKKAAAQKKSSPPATTEAALPTPLPAAQFQGRVREAYQVAADMPQILAGLACYCGCDKSQGHRHLLDCFVDTHGST